MSTSSFNLQIQNLRDKATTLFSPAAPTTDPSLVGTPSGADVGGVARLPSSAANAVQDVNAKPSKGTLFYSFFPEDSSSVCGVKRGVGTTMCIDIDCKVVAHQGKFCHVLPNHVYVKKNDSTAFLEPSVDVSQLSLDIKALWEVDAVTLSDWQSRFQQLEAPNGDLLPLEGTTESIKKAFTFRSPLQSPTSSPVKEDLCQDIPSFKPSLPPVGASNLNEVVPPALLKIETALAASIEHYAKSLATIQDRFTEAGTTASEKYDEITWIGVKVDSFMNSIGNLPSSDFSPYSSPTLASTIEQIACDLTTNVHPIVSAGAIELTKVEGQVSTLVLDFKVKMQEELDARLFFEKEATEIFTTVIERLSEIGSRLSAFEAAFPTAGNSARSAFATFRSTLETGSSSPTPTPPVHCPAPIDEELSSKVADLCQRLTNLESGSSGDGVSINGNNFENLEELADFMEDNEIKSVGEFVCVYVALQERVSHNDGGALLGRLDKQRKLELNSNYEAYAVESFTSDIPGYFHSDTKTTDFDKSYLNNLPNHTKWAASSHGVKATILKDILSITNGYTQWINSQFKPSSPAYHLAMYCLMKTTEFLRAWLTYIDYVIDDLVVNGYTMTVAFAFATRLSRRMCEDMSVPRQGVKGSLGGLIMRPTVLWGILRTHVVMQEYLEKDFRNHPSMASEFVRFVVTSPRDVGTSSLETQVVDLKKKVSEQKKEISEAQKSATTSSNKVAALTASLKSFETRVKTLEK